MPRYELDDLSVARSDRTIKLVYLTMYLYQVQYFSRGLRNG